MKIQLLITTYNRPQELLLLLKDIKKNAYPFTIGLSIINDCSKGYDPVLNYLDDNFHQNFDYFETSHNYGKKDYWKIIDYAYSLLRNKHFDYFIQIPDDIRLVDDFFEKAVASFEAIQDPQKACVNLLNDFSRNGKAFWTNQSVKKVEFGNQKLLYTGWVDMCFISNRCTLEDLNYQINAIDHNWSNNPTLSSGVGRQISKRLVELDKNIYQVQRSLVIHLDHQSMMHPDHRKAVRLLSNHYTDTITATMATMPGREASLLETVESIIDQVDELHIYFNNISSCPELESNAKIKCYFSENECGDLGDAGKFFTCDQIRGYHFSIDDDIIYPGDYVSTMIQAIEQHERRVVVSCHGRLFEQLPVQSYYKGHTAAFSCLGNVAVPVFAHVIGTGVLAFHSDTIKLQLAIFEYSNMADIWFSKHCNENNVPRLIIPHIKGWLKLSNKYDDNGSIYRHQSINDSFQTQITNSVDWHTVL